jgi:hypothetical protein
MPAMDLFGSSGHLDWGMACAYIGLTIAFFIGSRIVLLRKNPDLYPHPPLSVLQRCGVKSKTSPKHGGFFAQREEIWQYVEIGVFK